MIALLDAWGSGLVAAPATMAAVVCVVLAWCAAAVAMLARIRGIAWRAAWCASASGVLLALVAFIAPPPQRTSAAVPVLVTEGARAEALAAVSAGADAFVTGSAWTTPDVASWIGERTAGAVPGRTIRIASVDDVALYGAVPRTLRVVGDGLDAAAWAAARWRGDLAFTPPTVGAGFASADWPRRVDAGDPLPIAIAVTAATPEGAAVSLRDDRGIELARGAADAVLDGPVLPVGRFRLSLVLEHDGRVLDRIDVTVRVVAPPPARVLVLAAAPSFEWRALGRWLADTGARVASRVRVSASRYRQRFDGFDPMPLTPLTRELIDEVDLVLADGAALAELTPSEQQALLSQPHGAGVLVLLHDANDVAGLPAALRALVSGDVAAETVYQIAESAPHLPSGLTRVGLGFSDAAGEALLRDLSGRAVVARAATGSAVALSLLRDSYRLVGAGEADAHARLWSRLVRALARPAAPRDARVSPVPSRAGQRIRVCVPSAASIARVALVDGHGDRTMLPLVETPWRPAERCGWTWPPAAGWLEVRSDASEPALLGAHWVAPADAYPTPWRLARIRATSAAAAQASGGSVPDAVPSPMPRSTLLPVLLVFVVLTALIERLAAARLRGRVPR